MELATQLSAFVSNQPGILANLCGSLTDEKISIMGISVVDHTDYAVIRLVVSDSNRAVHLLGEAGLFVLESGIIRIELPEGPGGLEKVLKILADAKINVLYLYGTEPGSNESVIYLHSSDNKLAFSVLRTKLNL